jgi:hypothetical protein
MKTKHAFIFAILVMGVMPAAVSAQGTVPPRARLGGNFDGQLLTLGDTVRALAAEDVVALEFAFTPEARARPTVQLGVDYGKMEPSFGPDCGSTPCQARVFSVPLERSLKREPEGWGQLTVRELGNLDDAQAASARVYWDATPPRAPFLSPRFNASLDAANAWQVIAHTLDEDIIVIKVTWMLAVEGNRNIPLFEQHQLGFDFAGHAACVPTAVGANLKWLQITSQWTTMEDFFTDDFTVNSLGFFMNTTAQNGTSGTAAVTGTVDFLNFWFGYQQGMDFSLEHLGMNNADGTYGFTPEQMLEQFQAGGAISLGFHNMPHINGNLLDDPPFGHFLALDNVILNQDGTAWLRIMDPNVEPYPPGSPTGAYRWFKLHGDGSVEWTNANPGYYNPYSGLVRLDELHIIRDYHFFDSLGTVRLRSAGPGDPVPISGEVPGVLTNGGHTFVGNFRPPEGSPGPWLLISESTHAAGHTQRAYRYVGGKFGSRPAE